MECFHRLCPFNSSGHCLGQVDILVALFHIMRQTSKPLVPNRAAINIVKFKAGREIPSLQLVRSDFNLVFLVAGLSEGHLHVNSFDEL